MDTNGFTSCYTEKALGGVRVTAELPHAITVDHGTEFMSRVPDEWCNRHRVILDFIRSGKPAENVFIKSFNGQQQDACLNVTEFISLEYVRPVLDQWREDYNHHRPLGSIGNLTPSEFARKGQTSDDRAPSL